MHIHYPMRVVTADPDHTIDRLGRIKRRPLLDKVRLLLLRLFRRLKSDETFTSGERVNMELMKKGGVGVAFSVLYVPEAEWDLFHLHGVRPQPEYFAQLMGHMALVEQDVEGQKSDAVVVRDAAGLDRASADGKIAIVHCVEGGFHLGSTEGQVEASVRSLREAGVAYITLAHLFWRRLATNVSAFPGVGDGVYKRIFCQPDGEGLGPLGRTAVAAMAEEGILVDISHMRADAVDETFEVLERWPEMPVIASHAGFRFGELDYMLDEPTVTRIKERDGVIGLIMAKHQLTDGLPDLPANDFKDSVEVICKHIERIHEITGSYHNIAIGSDLDGFIKPTIKDVDNAEELGSLAAELEKRCGDENAALITSGNAIRVLKQAWAQRPA